MRRFASRLRARRIRPISEFAEDEIVVTDGPHKGPFRIRRQPVVRILFDAIDSGDYTEFWLTAPSQTGKTLAGWVIPCLWHLFEWREKVIVGLPNMDMAGDKWREDLLPVIERTRYRQFLPKGRGLGSRGGSKLTKVEFSNGATLRFMTGGGGDKQVAGYTARVLIVTEAEAMASGVSSSSAEADRLKQLQARQRSYRAHRRRTYVESTLTTPDAAMWSAMTEQGRMAGVEEPPPDNRIATPCPHCQDHVSLERDDLVGWQDAESEEDAMDAARFACSACGEAWSEDDRRQANELAKMLMYGQSIGEDGEVTGPRPRSTKFCMRWTASNNLLLEARDYAQLEHRAERLDKDSPLYESAMRELMQFTWAWPYEAAQQEDTPLTWQQVTRRAIDLPRGIVPVAATHMGLGIDIAKRLANWSLIAFLPESCHVVDYGLLEIHTDEWGFERAALRALREFRDQIEDGWESESGPRLSPNLVLIDRRYDPDVSTLTSFCDESGERYMTAIGLGQSQAKGRGRTTSGGTVKKAGEHYKVVQPEHASPQVQVDADYWKLWVHRRLATDPPGHGTMSLFAGDTHGHGTFAKQVTAESVVVEFIEGKGEAIKWTKNRRHNHYLDAAYLACVAGHMAGYRLIVNPVQLSPPRSRTTMRTMPDGRPFLSNQR